jgi:transcriptional regulator with XRE-family HTH domain
MMEKGYKKICKDLVSDLKDREREVIVRRFGLEGKEKETLQSIGDSFGITRERVRQIENAAINKIRPKLKKYRDVFEAFLKYFKKFGEVRKEKKLLEELGGKEKNELVFLLSLDKRFLRFNQSQDFHSLWTTNLEALEKVKNLLSLICKKFEKEKKLMTLKEVASEFKVREDILEGFLEISKRIQKNKKGFYGLREWPEINPRSLRDKAYLVFKELQKPLHFTEVARMIEGANLKSVHNELIRDERFVLIGRGIYALREWGYFPGEVKDVIYKFLKEEGPLTKEEILERIRKQRVVKENTVLINLAKYFEKDEKGRYRIKTAEI